MVHTVDKAASESGSSRSPTSKGPVELLCDEIGFTFDRRLERPCILRAFVRELVGAVDDQRRMQVAAAAMTGKLPSGASGQVLNLARAMVTVWRVPSIIAASKLVHSACDRLNPDGAYPTDHLIDMLSSCASALRFGLEPEPVCRSRHAAEAANHVWKQVYGISLFDRHSPAWGKEWARAKLQSAIISLLPADGAHDAPSTAEAPPGSDLKPPPLNTKGKD